MQAQLVVKQEFVDDATIEVASQSFMRREANYVFNMYFVYILLNNDGKRYIGMTSNLDRRLKEHKQNQVDSTRGDEYNKVWHCVFTSKDKAVEFEKYLKSSSGYAFANKHLIGQS